MTSSECDTTAVPARRRMSPAKSWVRALELTAGIANRPERLLFSVIEEWAESSPSRPALISDRECLSYGALAGRSNRCTRWALLHGIAKGDTVCLLMPNRPEYMAIWLGLTRAGCTVALLNTNLRARSLAHSINIVAATHIIVAGELVSQLNSALPYCERGPQVWVYGSSYPEYECFDDELSRLSGDRLEPDECPKVTIYDRALYIYTSGTTGLPKAANISHARLMQWSHWFAGLMDTGPDDRLYNCLPMYHSVGGIVATGAVLAAGGSVVLRETFSARQFWSDIVRWDCTLFQYIGELCRYLMHTPESAMETQHQIRLCCGNGLRPDIWDSFKDRFRIPRILEFYAATEGNVSMFNVEGKSGAIGRIPSYLAHRFPVRLVRFDVDKAEPVRDEQGYCVGTAVNEVGEALGRIAADSSSPGNRYEGYSNREESEKKILRNVFEQGDAWFRTGDLMRCDEQGYFYFVDRIGDTFRWKGENVSTTEVAENIATFSSIRHSQVYGVSVPGSEGRAGMATIVVREGFDLSSFHAHLQCLPGYAQPLFLRISSHLELTGTFKYTRNGSTNGAYNPGSSDDPIYFNDQERGMFVPVDADLHTRIQAGQVRV